MKISLRPHHLLCLKGYKGYNYSEAQISSWKNLSDRLNNNPQSEIQIVLGNDDLCKKCPAKTMSGKTYCKNEIVNILDNKVAQIFGFCIGKIYKYNEILNSISQNMSQQKHQELCSECMWWKKGLCRDSFEKNAD